MHLASHLVVWHRVHAMVLVIINGSDRCDPPSTEEYIRIAEYDIVIRWTGE